MASFISEFLSQRRRHFLSVISLTLSFIVVMTLDYSCRMIEKLFDDFTSGNGFEISELITENEPVSQEGLVKTYHSAYGECQVILADDEFYNLFDLEYCLKKDGIFTERVTVGYEVFSETLFSLNLNGLTVGVSAVIEKDYENLYFDTSRLMILPLKYRFLFPDAVPRYFFQNDLKSRFEEKGYEILSLQKSEKALRQTAEAIKGFIVMLSVICFAAALISLVNHSFSLLKRKEREIGIKKAFGASGKDIFMEQISETVLLVLISFVISIFVFNLIMGKKKEPVLPSSSYILTVILTAVGCGIIPALRASRIRISDAIRTGD
ncbi:MAG: ABC transporter permease [Erysipelotrichaceae bacterium]|nr:ABC transporter permease [Erysipelotrichaceae bacterium]